MPKNIFQRWFLVSAFCRGNRPFVDVAVKVEAEIHGFGQDPLLSTFLPDVLTSHWILKLGTVGSVFHIIILYCLKTCLTVVIYLLIAT